MTRPSFRRSSAVTVLPLLKEGASPDKGLAGSVLISSVSCSIFEDRRNYLIL